MVAAALNLLLAALHLVGPLRRQVLQVLVVPGQVDVARFPGVHQLLLGDPGGGAVGGLLGLLSLLGGGLFPGRLAVVPGAIVPGRAVPAPAGFVPLTPLLLALLPAAVPVVPGAVVFGAFPRLRGVGENGLQVRDLVVLGQVFKDDGQFLVVQHLHVVFRGCSVCGEDLGDVLGLFPKILGYFMHTIFFKTQIKPPPSQPGPDRDRLLALFSPRPGTRRGYLQSMGTALIHSLGCRRWMGRPAFVFRPGARPCFCGGSAFPRGVS